MEKNANNLKPQFTHDALRLILQARNDILCPAFFVTLSEKQLKSSATLISLFCDTLESEYMSVVRRVATSCPSIYSLTAMGGIVGLLLDIGGSAHDINVILKMFESMHSFANGLWNDVNGRDAHTRLEVVRSDLDHFSLNKCIGVLFLLGLTNTNGQKNRFSASAVVPLHFLYLENLQELERLVNFLFATERNRVSSFERKTRQKSFSFRELLLYWCNSIHTACRNELDALGL